MLSLNWRTENRIRYWINEEEKRMARTLAALNVSEIPAVTKNPASPLHRLQSKGYAGILSAFIKT